ncbi:MAG: MopE-related protein, partial [Myxococcota bacterium]
MRFGWLPWLVAACAGDKPTGDTTVNDDLDGDHFHGANDCDDSDPTVYPGAPDPPYDGVDSDCAGDSDEDADRDSYDRDVDCDDAAPAVNPGAVEVCNGVDDDCDGASDGPDAADVAAYYPDLDDDDYGDGAAGPLYACELPSDGAIEPTDCDDTDADVHPNQAELCDGKDNDCDTSVDEDLPTTASWPDGDGDGSGDAAAPATYSCSGPGPGAAGNALDCDDGDPSTYTGAPDVPCDGVDNDCDAAADEPGVVEVDGVAQPDLATALAAAGPGSVIGLCEGRYDAVGLVVSTALTVSGAGSGLTVLDGLGSGAVLEVAVSGVTLSGLGLTGGQGHPDGAGTTRGGGLYVHPGVTLSAVDLAADHNRAGEGGGVWLGDGASLTWLGGSASDNVADDALADVFSVGGGVYAADGAELYLDQVEIARNVGARCGGVRIGELG